MKMSEFQQTQTKISCLKFLNNAEVPIDCVGRTVSIIYRDGMVCNAHIESMNVMASYIHEEKIRTITLGVSRGTTVGIVEPGPLQSVSYRNISMLTFVYDVEVGYHWRMLVDGNMPSMPIGIIFGPIV